MSEPTVDDTTTTTTTTPEIVPVEPVSVADPTPTPKKKFSRDEIRTAILDTKPKTESLEVFGVTIFLCEPLTSTVLELQAMEDRKAAMALMMTQYIYTADGESVFEEADTDALLSVPFGKDMQALNKAISAFLGVAPTAGDKSPAKE